MPILTRVLSLALLAGAVPSVAQTRATATLTDRTTGCAVELTAEWRTLTPSWTGNCIGGRAEGGGVLRMQRGPEVHFTFYGRMHNGRPEFGALQTPGGFAAGQFVSGIAQPTDDRLVFIKAFRTASAAAREASEQFRRTGNMASSRYYADMAERLADQMD